MVVLILTGIDMANDRLASWGDLTDTDYGQHLLEKVILVAIVIGLTLFHSLVQGPELSRLREQALDYPDSKELRRELRSKQARSGVVSTLNLIATLAVLVLAARLVTG
jgi:putative copper export protein